MIPTLGICETDILFGSQVIRHQLQVVSSISFICKYDGILGADFFDKASAIINFSSRQIHIDNIKDETQLNKDKEHHILKSPNLEKSNIERNYEPIQIMNHFKSIDHSSNKAPSDKTIIYNDNDMTQISQIDKEQNVKETKDIFDLRDTTDFLTQNDKIMKENSVYSVKMGLFMKQKPDYSAITSLLYAIYFEHIRLGIATEKELLSKETMQCDCLSTMLLTTMHKENTELLKKNI